MDADGRSLSRRRFIQGLGGAAAAVGATQAATAADAAAARPRRRPFRPRGRLKRRPNFLVILTDQYRYPVAYESQALIDYRERYYTAERRLRQNSLEFTNHYVMSAACAPSRASFFTGQYPSLHGVSQTDGTAKRAFEHDMYWLDPDTLPTMGDYFRAGGYETYFKGKWHVSLADIDIPGTHSQLVSYDDKGRRDPARERKYLEANRLDGYGFDGWIGPEPHGSNPLNSGSSARDAAGRDSQFAGQTVDLLKQLSRRRKKNPWLLVSSFLNPHDISVWGELTLRMPRWNLRGQLDGTAVPDDLFDEARYAATSNENLAANRKPTCQRSYKETYPKMLQPTANTLEYRKFYYQLVENVNREIQRVLDALAADPEMAANTIVVFTSDHGELLGAHGGLFQKWHQAYEETTHVPFVVHNPTLFDGHATLDAATSHADVIPTLLGLAGLNQSALRRELARTHTEVHPLPGRDLSSLILGEADPGRLDDAVYFMTDDEISRGEQQVGLGNRMYRSVVQPNHLETVVAFLPTGPGGAREKWKYTRYFDSPQFWSDPRAGGSDRDLLPKLTSDGKDVTRLIGGNIDRAGMHKAQVTVKREPVREEIEAYNLSRDPLELTNLAVSGDPQVRATLRRLRRILDRQRSQKRLTPSTGTVPGQRAAA
jgi:choline-sulfatase